MMTLLESYVRKGQRLFQKLWADSRLQQGIRVAGWFLAGLCFSAASLGNYLQPIAPAVLCAGISGWMPISFTLGGSLGYALFWGNAGAQGIVWMAVSLPVCALVYQGKFARSIPYLRPALAALTVAVTGVLFQSWRGDSAPIAMYLLRIGMAFGCTWLFILLRERRDPATEWVAAALGVLALAQIAPVPFLGLGYVAGGILVAVMPFPAVAMAGLALDLARITPVPMTAVLCLSYMLRLLPGVKKRTIALAPAGIYVVVMALCGQIDLMPLPALVLGGVIGVLLPGTGSRIRHHRGETGFAQVRLEMAGEVMRQTERLLLEVEEHPIDEAVLIQKAAERACGTCPCRKTCRETENAKKLPVQLLHDALPRGDHLSIHCKKRARLLSELQRSQDQLRNLKADRQRQAEYRGALTQQYRFLAEYLQDLADKLPQRGTETRPCYQPEMAVSTSGRERANGDRCLSFAGPECRYYVMICDGMGTGSEAAYEASSAAEMLRRLLMAGYPAPYALRSLNSLCALRGAGAAVTVDLAEFCLENGKVILYKWGASPSWLLHPVGTERIGGSSVPPGFSATRATETVERIAMRRGETLIMVSDGVDGEQVMKHVPLNYRESAGALASRILEAATTEDDATVAVIRLTPV